MKYVEALNTPKTSYPHPFVFMAGGITNCPNWQSEMALRLNGMEGTIFNPRRRNFPMDDPSAARKQIEWEHKMLQLADWILFWFTDSTLQPIALYELGAWSMTTKGIFVGVDPLYARKEDVIIQTGLVRPDIKIVHTLLDLSMQILDVGKKENG